MDLRRSRSTALDIVDSLSESRSFFGARHCDAGVVILVNVSEVPALSPAAGRGVGVRGKAARGDVFSKRFRAEAMTVVTTLSNLSPSGDSASRRSKSSAHP